MIPPARSSSSTGAGRAFCAGADRQRLEAGRVGAPRPAEFRPDSSGSSSRRSLPGKVRILEREFMDIRRYSYFMRIPKPVIAATYTSCRRRHHPVLAHIPLGAEQQRFFTTLVRAVPYRRARDFMAVAAPRRPLARARTVDDRASPRRPGGCSRASSTGCFRKTRSVTTSRRCRQHRRHGLAAFACGDEGAGVEGDVPDLQRSTWRRRHRTRAQREVEGLRQGVTDFLEKRKANFPDLAK